MLLIIYWVKLSKFSGNFLKTVSDKYGSNIHTILVTFIVTRMLTYGNTQ